MNRIIVLIAAILLPALAWSQIFFKVEREGLESPSYLFGTHHLAPLSVLDSIPEVVDALSDSSAVVGEIDMQKSQENPMALLPYMSAPADSTLTKLFTPERFRTLNEEFHKWTGGLDLSMFDSMKPIVANMTVALGMVIEDIPGYVPGEQLDTYVQTYARQAGKKVIALETVEQQGEYVFNGVPIAEQAKALAETLDNPAKAKEDAIRLNKCYFNQDVESLYRESLKENEDPILFENLLYRRNANWLEQLPEIFRAQPSFVAVGALHLAGEKGLVEGLRRLGFTVTPII